MWDLLARLLIFTWLLIFAWLLYKLLLWIYRGTCATCGQGFWWSSAVQTKSLETASERKWKRYLDDVAIEFQRWRAALSYVCPNCRATTTAECVFAMTPWEQVGGHVSITNCSYCSGQGGTTTRKVHSGTPKYFTPCGFCLGNGFVPRQKMDEIRGPAKTWQAMARILE